MPTTPRRMRENAACSRMMFVSVWKNGSKRYLFSKPVADSANRFQYPVALTFQFASKIFDMYIDHITKPDIIEVPEMAQEIFAIHDLIRMSHEVFEQSELF